MTFSNFYPKRVTAYLLLTFILGCSAKDEEIEPIIDPSPSPAYVYLDENGDVRDTNATASLPGLGSGSWAGSFSGGANGHAGFDALGNVVGENTEMYNFYDNISAANSQGFNLGAAASSGNAVQRYLDAINLLKRLRRSVLIQYLYYTKLEIITLSF